MFSPRIGTSPPLQGLTNYSAPSALNLNSPAYDTSSNVPATNNLMGNTNPFMMDTGGTDLQSMMGNLMFLLQHLLQLVSQASGQTGSDPYQNSGLGGSKGDSNNYQAPPAKNPPTGNSGSPGPSNVGPSNDIPHPEEKPTEGSGGTSNNASTDPPSDTPPPENAPTGAQPDSGAKDVKTDAPYGDGPNEMVLKNTDSKPMTVALFRNTQSGMHPNIDNPDVKYTIQPGEEIKVKMPDQWEGRAQKLSGNPNDPATWAEIQYENKNGEHKLWYDNSLIRGYNAAVTIKPTNSSNGHDIAGSGKSLLADAPDDAVTTDAGGNKVIKDVETYTGGVNTAAENYLNQAENENNSYIRHDDHNAVRTSTDNSLTVSFGAA